MIIIRLELSRRCAPLLVPIKAKNNDVNGKIA